MDTAGCAGPDLYPLDSGRVQSASTTSHILQRGFTVTPARCWAALDGADSLERPSCKSRLSCLAGATSHMFVFRLGKRRDHSGRHRRYPAFVRTKSLHNLCFICSSLAELPVILWYILKKSQQKSSPGIGVVLRTSPPDTSIFNGFSHLPRASVQHILWPRTAL